MQNPQQPKIVHKLLVRTFILLVLVAAVFLGIQKVLDWRTDSGSGTADSDGMIAAVQVFDNGQQAVIFDKTGKMLPSPEYAEGKTDRDVTWQPDGNAVFFVSDRREAAFNLYRWNPENGAFDKKSSGSISRFDPSFPIVDDVTNSHEVTAAGQFALIVQGGFVLNFNVKESTSSQILPPPGGVTVDSGEEGGGQSGQFDDVYKQFGTSFRAARWGKDQGFLAAVMKREEGEFFLLQNANPKTDQEKAPVPVICGEHVDFDVSPKTGVIVFALQEFLFPDPDQAPKEYIKNGKLVKPYHHGLFAMDPKDMSRYPITVSPDDKICFGTPVASPDGSQIAFTFGEWDGTDYHPKGLGLAAIQPNGGNSGSRVVMGEIYEPSWSPTGKSLVYVKRDGGKRSIYTIGVDGSGEKKISGDGDFIRPKFSPQTK